MMGSDGSSDVVDSSLYYPATSTYSYYCPGFESHPSEWDDHNAVFGLHGADIQYDGAQTENMPYIYYTPTYGFGESTFNPYNPYMPSAMLGVDGPTVGTQPYYTLSPYYDPASSSGYYPVLVQPGTDIIASSSRDTKPVSSSVNRGTGSNTLRTPCSHSHTIGGSKTSTGTNKRLSNNQNGHPGVHGGSSHVPQGRNSSGSLQSSRNNSYGKLLSQGNQEKHSFPWGGSLSQYESHSNGQTIINDPWSQFYYSKLPIDSYSEQLGEQNRGPRTNKSKNEIVVKAYTTKAGVCNVEGNIVISSNQYNKDDFPLDYSNAKFFVIKSYSEDDVHKSVKYNVWSSTSNGNKKLSSAYEDAQKIGIGKPRGCPIFLFFSVNASGQFCGVAEMVGQVDFNKDMDFWHQDKWSGSFPVKWHIIKDVSNRTFRHIILENNEHNPVTNSRDTQEIMHKQGLEMLKLFKDYSSKTSLLDDFMYYENRQKIMHDERTRHLHKTNGHAHPTESPLKFTIDNTDPSQKLQEVGTWVENEKGTHVSTSNGLKTSRQCSKVASSDISALKIGSLSIHPKPSERQSQAPTNTSSHNDAMTKTGNVVRVGSMPIEVDVVGKGKSSKMLTIGTIAFDPKAIEHGKMGISRKVIIQK